MIISRQDYIQHVGTPRHSGRYPWGSGGNDSGSPRNKSFLDVVNELRKQGLSESDIAKSQGMTIKELRNQKSIANNALKADHIAQAQRLRDKGMALAAIGERLGGRNESYVRTLLRPGEEDKLKVLNATSDILREAVDQKRFVDIGSGVEHHLAISRNKLDSAVTALKNEGYTVHTVQIDQVNSANKTLVKVLAPPGTTYRDIASHKDQISQIQSFSTDNGRSWFGIQKPLDISQDRIQINYKEDGGDKADGVIYIRRGKEDVSIGENRYAQVRVSVEGTHYLKGMAVYKDDLPPGIDIVFNTPKTRAEYGNDKLSVMKPMKKTKDGNIDQDNPFGAIVRQIISTNDDGSPNVTSAMNIVGYKEGSGVEGSWDNWSRNLPSQFLSKQSWSLAEQQLALKYNQKKEEFDKIMKLTNPVVKQKLLETFADGADSSAVHLKAAQLPRQSTHVILPVNSMKESEVFAPNFNNGERVVLVRFPHGGTFEIPELVVNNKNPEALKLLGNEPQDAIGINAKVAERLSGADFDGDTVLVIPNNSGKVKTSPALEGLKNFDHVAKYRGYEGMPEMTDRQKGLEMGKISNLITDMTIKGASSDELARAVRHSMVVIDAQKKNLDYKRSAIDHNIIQLKREYQGGGQSGASTLISRARSEERVGLRKPRSHQLGGPIDPKTGKKMYEEIDTSWTTAKGKLVTPKPIRSTKLAETDDAFTLSSGTPIEAIYANHSNKLKALANEARKATLSVGKIETSTSAKITYADEVRSLVAKLRLAERNRPLERQAQVVAKAQVDLKTRDSIDMTPEDRKKLSAMAIAEARSRLGAKKPTIDITPKEWEAIQAGAISTDRLRHILDNANIDQVKDYATPKNANSLSSSMKQRALNMQALGYTQSEIAEAIGVSVAVLKSNLSE